MLALYREHYPGFNVRHFHQLARRHHQVRFCYAFVKKALQSAGHAAGSPRKRMARRRRHGRGGGQSLPARALCARVQCRVRSRPGGSRLRLCPAHGVDLEHILCIEDERIVGRDNVVTTERVALPLAKQPGRRTCAGLHVLVRRHLNGAHSVWYGTRCLGRYDRNGQPVAA